MTNSFYQVNPEKFSKLITENGYFSFYLATKNSDLQLVIVKEAKDTVRVVNPVQLLPLMKECLNEGNSPEAIAKLKNSLINDKQTWVDHFVKILPNHFFQFMDKATKPHKKYVKNHILKNYVVYRLIEAYKGGAFETMIEAYAQYKKFTVVWGKGKIRFLFQVHKQLEMNINEKTN